MSQDFDIRTTNKDGLDANGPGLKQVLYGNFLAIVTQFAGETAPTDTYQGMPWLDISEGWANAKMKFWNGSEWVLQNEYNPYIKDLRVSRGTKNTLWERLEVALNEDGTIKSDLAENMTEWIDSALTATYVSAETFTVPGDYTDVFVTNRKVKATLDSESVYSAVESANYSSVNDETTIVLFDAVIDATIQKVEYGLMKAGGSGSLPRLIASMLNFNDSNLTFTAGDVQSAIDELENRQVDIKNKLLDNAGAHNSIYRGKYLGSEVTAEQYNAISNGTFEDLYIGDYWTIGGVNYRIAAFNYYYNTGDTALTDNHVTLVPDDELYTHEMNDSNTTDGGYIGSKMYTSGLDQAKTTINSAFGSHVVNHRKYLCNAVSSGEQNGGSWYDSEVELMNEIMVYGSVVNGGASDGIYNIGTEKTQLPLFSLRPDIANIRDAYWLRDVASGTLFANVNSAGIAHRASASYAFGVRPAFSIS